MYPVCICIESVNSLCSKLMNSIRVLQLLISDTLIEAIPPLYVAFVDFAKAFDSIDGTLLFGKLDYCGISTKGLWPLIKGKLCPN